MTTKLSMLKGRIAKRQQRGATVIEYALIAALIAVVIVVGVTALGENTNTKFQDVADEISGDGG